MTLIKSGRLLHQYIVDAYTSSFTAGPRYMAEKYQDAMAICRWYGNPNLFITVTANPNWVEISDHMNAVVYTIEFQKRGLPHAHILLWFDTTRVEPTPAMIDQYISAELPNKLTDPEGFELVKRHMMHGPCGVARPKSPCMENGKCTKSYPKPLTEYTMIDKSGFVVYRRRDNTSGLMVESDEQVGNEYVVPHNLQLLRKYKAHINVEWC